MNENIKQLLTDISKFFYSVGVTPNKGRDGQLLSRIEEAIVLGGSDSYTPNLVGFNPTSKTQCPICKAPDFNECGCPADQQMSVLANQYI